MDYDINESPIEVAHKILEVIRENKIHPIVANNALTILLEIISTTPMEE